MKLNGLKWLTAALVVVFLIGFDYLRHFVYIDLLHHWPFYLTSVGVVLLVILVFNHIVFRTLASMQRDLRQQNQRLEVLNAVGSTLSHSLNLDELLEHALQQILLATRAEAAVVRLVERERLLILPSPRLSATDAETFQNIPLRSALTTCAGNLIARMPVDQCATDLAPDGLSLWAAIPLQAQGTTVGYLLLITRPGHHPPEEQDARLLAAIGAQISIAIENTTLHNQIARQARSLTTLIESSGNAIITIDKTGRVLSWNRAAEMIYGWSRQEAIGQVLPMVPAHLRDEATELMHQVIGSDTTIANVETNRLRKDGEQIPVMVTISPIHGVDGSITGIMGVSTDMRDRKRLERELLHQQRELAVLAERERLARTLHDDVGQVLGYVNTQTQAVSELIAVGQTTPAARQLARMADVVQEAHDDVRRHILDLQAETRQQRPFPVMLEDYLRRYRRHDDFNTELHIAGTENLQLSPDTSTQLLHIVQEAVTNARRHAKARRVTISCTDEGESLIVTVTDDGQGFDPARVASSNGGHFGLRIMRDRAAEIGGSLDVRSQPGLGTTVIVRAPTTS